MKAGGLLTVATGLTSLALLTGLSLGTQAHAQAGAAASGPASTPETTAVCEWTQPNGIPAIGTCPPPEHIKNYTVRQVSEPAPNGTSSVVRIDSRPDAEMADDIAAHLQQQRRDLQAGVSSVQTADTPSVTAANLALQQAEAKQQAGREPLPGERRGLANGNSRLLPTYFDRQDKLATDVKDARSELNDAREAARD